MRGRRSLDSQTEGGEVRVPTGQGGKRNDGRPLRGRFLMRGNGRLRPDGCEQLNAVTARLGCPDTGGLLRLVTGAMDGGRAIGQARCGARTAASGQLLA